MPLQRHGLSPFFIILKLKIHLNIILIYLDEQKNKGQ